MWPIPARTSALMVIGFNNNQLVLSHYAYAKQTPSYFLNAYQRISLTALEYENGVIFNPTKLKNHIKNFVQLHNLSHATALITVARSAFTEQIIITPHADPSWQDLHCTNNNAIHKQVYLYAQENGFAFYTYSIKKEHLFQYQLLAIAADLHVSHIVAENCARLELYYAIKGHSIRQAQLAVDLQRSQYVFDSLTSMQDIQKILKINAHLYIKPDDEFLYLSASLGTAIIKNR